MPLQVVGQKIAQLEARKRAAVEKEDYDTAKVCSMKYQGVRDKAKCSAHASLTPGPWTQVIKADIDKLRAAGESAAGTEPQPSRNKDPQDIFGRVLRGSAGTGGGGGGGGGASHAPPPPAGAPAPRMPSRQVCSYGGRALV